MQSPGQLQSQVVGYDLTSHLVFALSASETQAILLTPPPTPPQIHAPKFNISLQNLDSTGNREEGREGKKGGRERTKTEVQAEPQSILPISPAPPTAGLNLGRISCLQYCRWQAPPPTLGPYASLWSSTSFSDHVSATWTPHQFHHSSCLI